MEINDLPINYFIELIFKLQSMMQPDSLKTRTTNVLMVKNFVFT